MCLCSPSSETDSSPLKGCEGNCGPGRKLGQPTAGFMTHVTCRLTAKNRDQLRNPTLGNRVTFCLFLLLVRWFLDIMCYPRRSRLFLLNGFAMATTFFLSRIASIPPYWYKVYSVYGSATSRQLGVMWSLLIFSCVVLDLINIFWFCKIFQGVRRAFRCHNDVLVASSKCIY